MFSYRLFIFVTLLLSTNVFGQGLIDKPRIIISTDIGGTDPDDNQSMIHLLMYSDKFDIEGLISSPFGKGRKEEILRMIDIYEKDYAKLNSTKINFYHPDSLRLVCKQGLIPSAPFTGYSQPSEGSDWIIHCAKKKSTSPLWILVWGGLEDLAQALHDDPDIASNIRVFWIGGPNKKWSINAYHYIAMNHPNLWMIESNATYRGLFSEDNTTAREFSGKQYYNQNIKNRGAMGHDFENYYNGEIKMGDTPSLAYLLRGDQNNPMKDSWAGIHVPIRRSSRYIYRRNTTIRDTVVAYAVIEWHFNGLKRDISKDSSCFTLEIQGQTWPGYYLGDGVYAVRYASKQIETCQYTTSSSYPELNGLSGEIVSVAPWPGQPSVDDYILGKHWYGDSPDPLHFVKGWQGAKTLQKFRTAFLEDWKTRWRLLE